MQLQQTEVPIAVQTLLHLQEKAHHRKKAFLVHLVLDLQAIKVLVVDLWSHYKT